MSDTVLTDEDFDIIIRSDGVERVLMWLNGKAERPMTDDAHDYAVMKERERTKLERHYVRILE